MDAIKNDLPTLTPADHATAHRIQTTLLKIPNSSKLQVGFAYKNGDYFYVRVRAGLSILSAQDVHRLSKVSARIRDIQVYPERRLLTITVWCEGAAKPMPTAVYAPPRKRKARRTALDWDAARVSDVDDQQTLASVMDDVYNVVDLIPDMQCWFEPILGDGAVHKGVPIPRTAAAADELSESSEDAADRATEEQRLGYALCFSELPDMSCSFLQYLRDTYHSVFIDGYIWFDPPFSNDAVLVVLLRRAQANPGARVEKFTPRGQPALKRQRRVAA